MTFVIIFLIYFGSWVFPSLKSQLGNRHVFTVLRHINDRLHKNVFMVIIGDHPRVYKEVCWQLVSQNREVSGVATATVKQFSTAHNTSVKPIWVSPYYLIYFFCFSISNYFYFGMNLPITYIMKSVPWFARWGLKIIQVSLTHLSNYNNWALMTWRANLDSV